MTFQYGLLITEYIWNYYLAVPYLTPHNIL